MVFNNGGEVFQVNPCVYCMIAFAFVIYHIIIALFTNGDSNW